MKQLWTEPMVEVETFAVENVLTSSSNGDFNPDKPEYEGPIIPL